MSVFHQLTDDEIRGRYTHYGWFLGLVPVYLARPEGEGPDVCERNWVPEWWFWLVFAVWNFFCCVCWLVNPAAEPDVFPLLVGDKIE